MSKSLCYYSHISEEFVIDDTYDLIFEKEYAEKPFHGIMRMNFTRSLSYLAFFNHFCDCKGIEKYLSIIKSKDSNPDSVFNIMAILGHFAFLVPRMGINRYLPNVLAASLEYIKENCKQLSSFRLDVSHFFIDTVGRRLYSLSEKHQILHELRRFLAL